MSAARPNLQFMASLDRTGLRAHRRCIYENCGDEGNENPSQHCGSFGVFDSSQRGLGARKIYKNGSKGDPVLSYLRYVRTMWMTSSAASSDDFELRGM